MVILIIKNTIYLYCYWQAYWSQSSTDSGLQSFLTDVELNAQSTGSSVKADLHPHDSHGSWTDRWWSYLREETSVFLKKTSGGLEGVVSELFLVPIDVLHSLLILKLRIQARSESFAFEPLRMWMYSLMFAKQSDFTLYTKFNSKCSNQFRY